MDTDWNSVLQCVGEPFNLEYNEKIELVGQADELAIQLPTPVSVTFKIIILPFNLISQSSLMTAHLSLTIKTRPALSFPSLLLFSLDPSILQPRPTPSFWPQIMFSSTFIPIFYWQPRKIDFVNCCQLLNNLQMSKILLFLSLNIHLYWILFFIPSTTCHASIILPLLPPL